MVLASVLLYGGGVPSVVLASSSEAETPVAEGGWSHVATTHGEARIKLRRRPSRRFDQAQSSELLAVSAAAAPAVALSHAPLIGPRLSLGTCVPLRC